MIKLQLKFKNTTVRELLTDKNEISVGRDAINDLCIDNFAASSRHARIFKGPGKYAIEDLNSTNGTFINNKEIRTQLLDNNDEIQDSLPLGRIGGTSGLPFYCPAFLLTSS